MNRKDPICGMTGIIERHGRWFCSESCIKKFEERLAAHGACPSPAQGWWLDPWAWVPLTGALAASAGNWWPVAASASHIYLGYLYKVVIPLLIGLLIGGIIDYFVPKEYIIKLLAGSRKRVILRSTLLGFLASTCSHGCLALTIELYRKGASTPAVVSFLLASPWASMSLTLLLLGLFGAKGLIFIIGALVIALITGFVFQQLAKRGLIELNPHTLEIPQGFSIRQDMLRRWQQHLWTREHLASDVRGVIGGMIPLGRMVLGWVQLGLLLSAILGAVVPHHVFEHWFGPSLLGLLVTLGFAAVMEVCSEGTAPLAFELYRHTGAFGNSFAFLMGGVVTDYTELGALWVNIGRRTVLWLLLVTLPQVIVLGFLLNAWKS